MKLVKVDVIHGRMAIFVKEESRQADPLGKELKHIGKIRSWAQDPIDPHGQFLCGCPLRIAEDHAATAFVVRRVPVEVVELDGPLNSGSRHSLHGFLTPLARILTWRFELGYHWLGGLYRLGRLIQGRVGPPTIQTWYPGAVFEVGEIISYQKMCSYEGMSLQRGMNYRVRGRHSIILMSVRAGAPYADRVEENGRVLIYEGHDIARTSAGPNPKSVDQPLTTPTGGHTQNALFLRAAEMYKQGEKAPERVRVYEKIKAGIWAFAGIFDLIDAWQERVSDRNVFKFKLQVAAEVGPDRSSTAEDLEHIRMIPTAIKLAVWKRDQGACVKCGKKDNLHFDHLIPYSRGGSSLLAENIQLLCARHNLEKRDRIE